MSSWLSNRLGIHIGSGPKKIDVNAPPASVVALGPDAVAQWQQMTNQVNGTIGKAQKLNTGAEVVAGTALGGEALGAFGGGGVGAIGSKVPLASGIPGLSADGSAVDPSTGMPYDDGGSSIWDKVKGLGSDALDKLSGGKGTGLDKLLMLAGIANAAFDKKHQQDLENKALGYTTDSYSARQPLRQQGLAMLQSQQTPDLSFLNNPANPYSKPVTPFNPSAKTPILPTGGTY